MNKLHRVFHGQPIVLGIFAVICILVACDQEDDLTPGTQLSGECLSTSTPIDFTQPDCFTPQTTSFCDSIYLDSVLRFDSTSYAWLPWYCLTAGDQIKYVDENGNTSAFSVTGKGHGISKRGISAPGVCNSDSNLNTWYCFNTEFANISLEAPILEKDLIINLDIKFEFQPDQSFRQGAGIQVRTINLVDPNPSIITHLFAVVDPGDLQIPHTGVTIEYYEEIELLGRSFLDVYSSQNTFPGAGHRMYYNKEYGIVGFEDNDGRLWRLEI